MCSDNKRLSTYLIEGADLARRHTVGDPRDPAASVGDTHRHGVVHQGLAGAAVTGEHHLVVPAPASVHYGDLLPPHWAVYGDEAALTHDEVEEGAESHHQLQTTGYTGHGIEAELVHEDARTGPGDEPAGP